MVLKLYQQWEKREKEISEWGGGGGVDICNLDAS